MLAVDQGGSIDWRFISSTCPIGFSLEEGLSWGHAPSDPISGNTPHLSPLRVQRKAEMDAILEA